MIVATANILKTLSNEDAASTLNVSLSARPRILGVQELRSRRVLKRFGRIHRFMSPRMAPRTGYIWCIPMLGGPPVAVDAGWGKVLTVRRVKLAPGNLTKRVRPTYATEVTVREWRNGRDHVVLNIHLMAHHNRPANRQAWRTAYNSLVDWCTEWTGYDRWVIGDTNKHLMTLPGLVSCWVGHEDEKNTFGSRKIDTIYGEKRAVEVGVATTKSDHNAVAARYRKGDK